MHIVTPAEHPSDAIDPDDYPDTVAGNDEQAVDHAEAVCAWGQMHDTLDAFVTDRVELHRLEDDMGATFRFTADVPFHVTHYNITYADNAEACFEKHGLSPRYTETDGFQTVTDPDQTVTVSLSYQTHVSMRRLMQMEEESPSEMNHLIDHAIRQHVDGIVHALAEGEVEKPIERRITERVETEDTGMLPHGVGIEEPGLADFAATYETTERTLDLGTIRARVDGVCVPDRFAPDDA